MANPVSTSSLSIWTPISRSSSILIARDLIPLLYLLLRSRAFCFSCVKVLLTAMVTVFFTGGSDGGMVECSQWHQSIRFGGLVAVINHQQEWEKEEHKWGKCPLFLLVCWVHKGKNKIVLVFFDWNPCRMKGNMGFIKRKRRREG
uniref:Uncharacterized protein n=1 Tax=Lactuca sativa TaxID=4236 RepID=A0A9R1VX94_LACSA|nr:hypothetical protein LSAT_V11C400192340 [Lactuca sativa]